MTETISYFTILMYYILIIFSIAYLFKRYKLCPQLIWLFFQLLMFFGITSNYIDLSLESDRQMIDAYFLGLLSYLLSITFFILIYRPLRNIRLNSNLENYKIRRPYLYMMILVSTIACFYFFISAGGNVFVNGIHALITGTDYSVKYARMGFLSVLGVGYIYQLRVTVLPLCILYYVMINKKTISSYVLSTIMIVFLVGTGQRGGFASFIAIVLITIYYWTQLKNKVTSKEIPLRKSYLFFKVIAIAMILFGLSTIINGRVSETGTVFSAILKRLLNDNQACAVVGFRYIVNENIQYGRDWLMQLIDILPGKNQYTSLDTRIFAVMNGGSMAGTAPPCIWGSAYYNFEIFGVILIGVFLGWLTTKIHATFSRKKCDEVEIIAYSALQFLVAYWVAGGPIVLFNNGFITVIIFYFVMHMALKYRICISKKAL